MMFLEVPCCCICGVIVVPITTVTVEPGDVALDRPEIREVRCLEHLHIVDDREQERWE